MVDGTKSHFTYLSNFVLASNFGQYVRCIGFKHCNPLEADVHVNPKKWGRRWACKQKLSGKLMGGCIDFRRFFCYNKGISANGG